MQVLNQVAGKTDNKVVRNVLEVVVCCEVGYDVVVITQTQSPCVEAKVEVYAVAHIEVVVPSTDFDKVGKVGR